ncbi:MAG: AEC family transporter [Gammaproteobacteria bacterium]|jgi:malate permease and related proteins|nr:AEC family transporter [Gammaproteobacteria bacterium]
MLQEVFTIVAPVFTIAALGFIWHRRQQPFHTDTIGSLVMYIGSPCLIYSSLTSNSPSLTTLAQTASIAAFVIICSTAFAFAFLRVTGWSYRTYVPALVLPNGGNMGLPICLLAFGETGLALGMAYFFVNSISQYTLGMAISSGEFHLKQLLKQPVIWAVLLVLGVLATEFKMPQWIDSTATILGGLTIPAMLLMLGTSLANLNLSALRETFTVASTRLLLGLGLGVLAIWLFELEGILAGVVLLQAAMPSAVFNYVFAERYNREPDKVAAVILQSTLISIISLPILVAWALTL